MPTYRELLTQLRGQIDEVSPQDAAALEGATFVDVRERDEWDVEHIPGAVYIPRSRLEGRIETVVPERSAPIVLYCESGNRSLFAAKALQELGYEDTLNLAGGIVEWKRRGLPVEVSQGLSIEARRRYSRHLLIPEVGEEGQLRLLDSKVLLIGAGGLGSPAALYLAAAGVGTLGIVDDDEVDLSNLQRQVIHTQARIGEPKVDSAAQTIAALNPDVDVVPHRTRLSKENVLELIADYDVIVDGADNFPTRYLLNDAAVRLRKPVVHASILGFDGQLTVFVPYEGPCYRCLYPQPPPADLAPSCGANGVLGVLRGIMGLLQANEAIKLIIGAGEPLVGRLLLFEALSTQFTTLRVRRDAEGCPVCGDDVDLEGTEFEDYEALCAAAG